MNKQREKFLNGVCPLYDLEIVNTPPILAVTDPVIAGKHIGITILVTRFGLSPIKEIEHIQHRFEQNGIDVKGAILNAAKKKAS